MRFSVVAAFFAGAVMAHGHGGEPSTVYATEIETITSCGPSVPDCPASTATYMPEEPDTEVPEVPVPEPTLSVSIIYNNGSHPVATEHVCPGVSVKTISTSVTTVIPTVIYETVEVPCETATPVVIPTGGYASPSTGVPSETPVFTGGASGMSISLVAAAAGLVAFLA